jgi:hypothetical protein
MTPVPEDKFNPAGKLPALMDHVYGVFPPVAVFVTV